MLSKSSYIFTAAPHSLLWMAFVYLKDYKGAVDAFGEALKLDPMSDEVKNALR